MATNGQVAIEKLQRKIDDFDVVLMDVQMPILDGYEATRRIRADLGLLDLPIIALTAGALSSERKRAAAVGMNDFIIKPFDAATLIASVMRHAVGVRGSRERGPLAIQGRSTWPEIVGIDMEGVRSRFCDDSTLFRSLLQRFLKEYSGAAFRSPECLPSDLAEQAGRLHTLKGGAGILGVTAIQQLASQRRRPVWTAIAPGRRNARQRWQRVWMRCAPTRNGHSQARRPATRR